MLSALCLTDKKIFGFIEFVYSQYFTFVHNRHLILSVFESKNTALCPLKGVVDGFLRISTDYLVAVVNFFFVNKTNLYNHITIL